ncbi:MAG: hypothetical protein V3R99_03730 [Thermoguttaceae bacterium]
MNHLIDHAILLADASRWSNMSQRFRGQRTRIDLNDIMTGLLILCIAICVFWVLSVVIRLQDRHRTFTSPMAMFLSLCKAHRLRLSQGWLLWRVARAHRLRDPALVFVRPELFNPARLGPSLQLRTAQLKRLGDMLFVETDEDDEKPKKRNRTSEEESPGVERTATSPGATSPGATSSNLPPALDVAPWPPLSGFEQDAPGGDQQAVEKR